MNSIRKYLLLVPMILLLWSCVYFCYAARQINGAMLRQKLLEVTDLADSLAAAAEANTERQWQDHEANIKSSAEFIDKLYQIYGAVYKPASDGKLELITARNFETSIFEPLDYPEFLDIVNENTSGNITIGYTPEEQTYRDLHMYYRWMPLYSPADERYLVVAGVSQHSVVTKISLWVSIGLWGIVIVNLILCLCLAIRYMQLGHIWDARKGDRWHKWRPADVKR